MQIKLIIAITIIFAIYAFVTNPFKNAKKLRTFASHLATALLTYYVLSAILILCDVKRDLAITIAATVTAIELLVINIFFRKPEA